MIESSINDFKSFQTLISTEATEKLVKQGKAKGRTLQKRRPVGSVRGPGSYLRCTFILHILTKHRGNRPGRPSCRRRLRRGGMLDY